MIGITEILQIIFSIFGVIGNALYAVTLFKKPFKSKVTNLLMSSQCVYDSIASGVYLAGRYLPPYQGSTFKSFDIFICYFWTSQVVYWIIVAGSVQTLVWIAIERYFAVIKATEYNRKQRIIIIISQIYIVSASVLLATPTGFDKHYVNDTCTDGVLFPESYYVIHKKIYAFFWYVGFYGGPILVFLFVYISVGLQIWRTRNSGKETNVDKKSKRMVTLTAVIITIQFVGCFSIDPNYYLLSSFGLADYVYFGPTQQLAVLLMSISTSINPIICMIMLRSRRMIAINMYMPCILKKVGDERIKMNSL